MLTQENKKQLYQLLSEKFPFEEPQPLAKVALYLSQQGVKSKDYGYKKVKLMFYDLAEFLSMREILCGTNPQQEIILHPWKEKKSRMRNLRLITVMSCLEEENISIQKSYGRCLFLKVLERVKQNL